MSDETKNIPTQNELTPVAPAPPSATGSNEPAAKPAGGEAPTVPVAKPEGEAPAAPKVEPAKTEDAPKPEDKGKKEDAPVVPEKYELTLPENSLLEPRHLAKIEAAAKAQGLTNEQAQLFVEKHSNEIAEDHAAMQVEWTQQLTKDPEIGGDKLGEHVELAKRALNTFADEEFKGLLLKTGYGSHPGMVRTFARIGKLMGEDKLVVGGTNPAPKAPSAAELFYGPDGVTKDK